MPVRRQWRTRALLDGAADELARAVTEQWHEEIVARGVLSPAPLPVTWTSILAPGPGRALAGRSDDLTQFIASFRALPQRRLVILGSPGAGKTTLTILLTLALLRDRSSDEPVPVPISLASWDPGREHLRVWLARRIAEDYPVLGHPQFGGAVARRLVTSRRVLPMLDGLDELPELRRVAVFAALERMLIGDPVVITCRDLAYAALVGTGSVLSGAAVVRAQPLPPAAILDHLREGIPPHYWPWWQPVFDELTAQPAGQLSAALGRPLMTELARARYVERAGEPVPLADTRMFPDEQSLETHLLDGLVPGTKTRHWLHTLATHLQRLETVDLAWWELHRYLSPRRRAVGTGLLAGLAWCLMTVSSVLAVGSTRQLLTFGLGWGLAGGLSVAAVFGHASLAVGRDHFRLPARDRMSALSPGANLVRALVLGVLAWLGLGAAIWVLGPRFLVLWLGSLALFLLIPAGLWFLYWINLRIDAGRAASPATTLREARRKAFGTSILAIVPPVAASWVLITVGTSRPTALQLTAVLHIGLAAGCWVLVRSPWGLYLTTRVCLAFAGLLPWRLGVFLEYARKRGVLCRSGAVHQFRHAQIRDRLGGQRGGELSKR